MVDAMRPFTRLHRRRSSLEPYVGPRAFQPEDATVFSCRIAESAALGRLWETHRVTVLSGGSGSGKTSLLNAGVYPHLTSAHADVLAIGKVGVAPEVPQPVLPEHNPYTLGLLSSWAPELPYTDLAGLTVLEFLRRRGKRTDRYGQAVPVLAAIDQAEDLFRWNPAYCAALIEELKEALTADSRLRLLLSVRDDYRDELIDRDYLIGRGDTADLRLAALSPDEAAAAVRLPVINSGRFYEPGAVEALVGNLRHESSTTVDQPAAEVEPVLLQVACAGIWETMPPDREAISLDDVSGAAVERSLTAYTGRVLSETADEYAASAPELLSWAVSTFGAGGAAEEGAERTAGMPNSIVRRLQDRHLLKAERRSGSHVFRLLDERLRGPLQRATVGTIAHPSAEESMLAAARALDEGDLARARRHALRAAEEPGAEIRLRAAAESAIGNIAYSQGDYPAAREHYHNAAALFETLQDTESVGVLLAAMGLTDVLRDRHSEAVTAMQGAISRNPTDSRMRSALTRTLREMNAKGRSS